MICEHSAERGAVLEWIKSSHSSSAPDSDCIEVAAIPGTVHVRDSKNADGPHLAFAAPAWAEFVAYATGR
ncbi:DUF397 domain-containing protein [Streptomyces sp. NPDC003077]|uniref:DUF397 domain-containing protein n=1 Tax=Streptomyces sp. NPDC003077 TaxID=3154443 RepID=UPI0033A250DA